MREYLLGLTLTCISAAIVKSTADDGGAKRYIDTVCSLCVVCALILPVLPVISHIDEYDLSGLFDESSLTVMESDGVLIYNDYVHSVSVEQAERFLETEICTKLDIKDGEVDIKLFFDNIDDQFILTEAVVYLYGGAITKDPSVIKDYIVQKTEVNCRIIY